MSHRRQAGQKLPNFNYTKLLRMAFAIDKNEAPYPAHIRLLRSQAVVPDPDMLADLIQQLRGLNDFYAR